MKQKIFGLLLALSLVLTNCETTQLELLDNPNTLNDKNADTDFYLNSIQLNFKDFFVDVTEEGMEITRILHMFGPTYPEEFAPSGFNDAWREAYSSILVNSRKLKPLAEEKKQYGYVGISQTLEAYTVATLVDYFGDVPYTQAVSGTKFLNPKTDAGSDIYKALYSLLDEAIGNLNKGGTKPKSDLYYNGDYKKWIKLANTLKIKLYLQTKLVNADLSKTEINKIIAEGNYIKNADDDFKFSYGTSVNGPDSRHPIYARNFKASGGVADYMSNYYMNLLLNEFGVQDPRVRYYIYRQNATNSSNRTQQDCFETLRPSHYSFDEIYCNLGGNPGYWGRDHGNENGIPPDTGLRATWGLYPIGGFFDNDKFQAVSSTEISTKGAGIEPIMMSSFVDFMLAEASLTLGTSGDAKTYLQEGISKSIQTVMNFNSNLADTNFIPSTSSIQTYKDKISSEYTAAASNDAKLDIIVKQYFIALWGNGVEAYNTFRRTGKPSDVQPLVRESVTNAVRSFYYPEDYIINNSNATQKTDLYKKVFWDNNADQNFIK